MGRRCNANVASHVMKPSAARAQFVLGVVCLNVLRQIVELHVAARDDDIGFLVPLHVIGAQAHIFVAQIHVAVRMVDLADFSALTVCLERDFAPRLRKLRQWISCCPARRRSRRTHQA